MTSVTLTYNAVKSRVGLVPKTTQKGQPMKTRTLLLITAAAVLALAGTAQAHPHGLGRAGSALERAGQLSAAAAAVEPAQTITVINQANVRPWALARVENAVVAQSLELRAAWATPCVRFASGGWPLELRVGGFIHGEHQQYEGPPTMIVYTAGLPARAWSCALSHEVVEALVDPTTRRAFAHQGADGVWTTGPLEVADPVEQWSYRLDGVWVSDFVFPAYFAGAQWEGTDALIAPVAAPGPYDEAGKLTGPWQTG